MEIIPPYTLGDMAGDLLVLMDGLQINKAHIVGCSMGGQIAQIFAIEYPQRLLSLCLIATSNGDPKLPPPQPEVLDFFFRPTQDHTDLESSIKKHIQQNKLYNHPDDFDLKTTTELYKKSYKRAYHPAGNQRQLLAMMFTQPWYEKLQTVQVPSLIIHGDHDPVAPKEHGKHLHNILPNSDMLVVEKMGHGIPPRACQVIVDTMVKHFNREGVL